MLKNGKRTMLKKLRDWMTWIFTNDSDESKKSEESKKRAESDDEVHYFEASWFFNDLENEDDYYLKVIPGEETEFVRKEEIDDN